jgi:type IV pilus assembly protein PilO
MSNKRKPSLWRERLTSPLTWHYVGFAVLLLVTSGLAIRLGMDWAITDSHASQIQSDKQVQLKALQIQTAPLHGLDKRLDKTRDEMRAFYDKRIPPNYSSIDSRIGELQVQSGVRLTRIQYTQGAPGADLTEISMDTGISGEYPQIMKFINSLERDQTFFLIRAMALTGEQGGLVNLRLRLSTWLRPADAAASGLPFTPKEDPVLGSPANSEADAAPGTEDR